MSDFPHELTSAEIEKRWDKLLSASTKHCTLCRLGEQEDLFSNCIPGRGPADAEIMLIGAAPGREEDEQGRPFVGAAGQKLGELIARAGFDESRLFITNVCRCRPPGNRAPKPDEEEACLPYLREEIERIQPKLVVLMGNTALRLLGSGYRTVTKERGEVYQWNGRYALVTFHPAALLRKWEDEEIVVSDLRLIHEILKRGLIGEEVDYRVVRDLRSLQSLAERLCNAKEFAFDLETRSFSWRTEPILCISFSDKPRTAFVVPLLGQNLSRIWEDEQLPRVHELLKQILESDVPKIGQNYKFDYKFLKHQLGISVRNVTFDTMIAHHLIDENLPGNLEFLSSYYLGIPRHDKELRSILTSRSMTFDLVPNKVLWKYSAADPDTTLRLKIVFEAKTNAQLLERVCMPLARALIEMEMCGVYIDRAKLEENSQRYAGLIVEEARKIFEAVGYEFKLGSAQQLSKVLFSPEGLGLPPAGLTGAGNYTTGRDAIEDLAKRLRAEGQIPEERLVILDRVIRYRNLRHWKTTFIDGSDGTGGLKRWIHEDSRIYPSYRQTGTDMGRIASREPNLQNIPRDRDMRNQFAAPPGWIFLHADYSQAEARTGAIVAHCKGLLEAMRAGLNIHRNAASKLLKIPYDAVPKDRYETIKFVTHGLHYGRSIPSIAGELEIPIGEVQAFVTDYFTEFPELAELMLSQADKVARGEPIVNAFGRVRHFPQKIGGHEKRQAISFPFASSWADAMNLATPRVLDRLVKEGVWLKDVKMTMTLHDALFFEVREDKLDKIVPMIIEEMEAPVPELDNYCFPIELEAGRCWEDQNLVVLWKGK